MLRKKLKEYKIILASGSPRRQQFFKDLDLDFEIRIKEIEEIYPDTLKASEITDYLADLKAKAFENNLEEILISNLPLGGMDKEQFTSVTRQFNSGDICILLSDGLPELPSLKNEMLDYPNVFKCILENSQNSAEQIKESLVKLADDWAGGLMNPDDITIVVLKKN